MLVSDLIGAILGGGGLMAIIGLAYNILSSKNSAKEARVKDLERRLSEIDKIDAEFQEKTKRIYYRMDVIENSQNKLEVRLDSDIKDVKRSLEKLSDLIVQALSKGVPK